MSKQQPSGETDSCPDDVGKLAASYVKATKQEPDQERISELEAEIEEHVVKRNEVQDSFGDEHYLINEIEESIQSLRSEREEIQQSAQAVDEHRMELLHAAAEDPGFRLTDRWLNLDVLEALTHALYGEHDDILIVAGEGIREPSNIRDMGKLEQIDLQKEVAALAQDRVSEHRSVREAWEGLEDSSSKTAFQAVAERGAMQPKEVAEYADTSASTVRNWFANLYDWTNFVPIYRPEKGVYRLSTAGKYYAAHYADLNGEDVEENKAPGEDQEEQGQNAEDGEDEVSEQDHEQQDLGNSDERPDNYNEGTAAADQGAAATKRDLESTTEKADKLFDEVSANRGSDTAE